MKSTNESKLYLESLAHYQSSLKLRIKTLQIDINNDAQQIELLKEEIALRKKELALEHLRFDHSVNTENGYKKIIGKKA